MEWMCSLKLSAAIVYKLWSTWNVPCFPTKVYLLNSAVYNLCRLSNFVCIVCFPGQEEDGRKVLVLSYPQYCRYRSVLARLREQPSSLLIDHTVLALGGIAALGGNARILYCRDTFEHSTLLQNESICDEFGECDSWRFDCSLLDKLWYELIWNASSGSLWHLEYCKSNSVLSCA